MTPRPWADPELTSRGRLPMHAVPHDDRLPLDGTWRFQLLRRPTTPSTGRLGRDRGPRLLDDAGHVGPADLHQRPDAVPQSPARTPDENPTGVYERSFEVPAAWAGRRVVLHVGAAESVLIVELNGEDVGISKDSHLAAEFDVTALVRPGANDLRLTVVKWSDASFVEDQDQWWHGGITRSVYLYATGPTLPRGRRRRRRAGRRRVDGDARAGGRRRLAGDRPGAGLAGRGDGRRARGAAERRTSPRACRRRGSPATGSSPGRRGAGSSTCRASPRPEPSTDPEDGARWREAEPVVRPPNVGQVRLDGAGPGVTPWSAEVPRCTGCRWRSSRPTAPSWSASSAGSGSGAWRSAASSCSSTGDARPDPRRQPPRLRPADRPRRRSPRTCAPTSSR